MTIGSVIKKLRRERDITQERLAELLNVSASAVSQWETDRVMPDVTQIPILANIFNVSADVILGIDIERKNEKINEILDTAENMFNNAEWQKAAGYLREQYRQYPRSYPIMEKLSEAIVNDCCRKGINDYDEAIGLCNAVLSECTDNIVRNKTLDILGTAYYYAGKEAEMLKIAEQMPEFRFSRERFMLYRVIGNKGFKQYQEYLAALIEQMVTVLNLLASHQNENGEFVYSIDDRIKLRKQLVGIIELLYPDGDYQIKSQHAEIACCNLAQTYFHAGDTENGFYWLDKTCDYAICMDTYDFDAAHTSPALRGYSDGGWIMEDGCNRSANLLDGLIEDKTISNIKKDERFEKIIARLKKYAKKP